MGILVSALVDWYLAASGNWRLMFGLSVVPAVLMIGGMVTMPESPRWLVAQGREPDALVVLRRLRADSGQAHAELAAITEIVEAETGDGSASWSELASQEIQAALFVGCGINFLSQAQGINTVIYFAPTIFTMVGFAPADAIFGLVLIDGVNVLATVVAMMYQDKVDRRTWLRVGSPGMTVTLVILAAGFKLSGSIASTTAVASLMGYVFFFCVSWGPLGWLINSEIYPLRVRGLCAGVSTATIWATNFVVSMTFLGIVESLGPSGAFVLYACWCIVGFWFVTKHVPETRGRTLEEIETIWAERAALSKRTDQSESDACPGERPTDGCPVAMRSLASIAILSAAVAGVIAVCAVAAMNSVPMPPPRMSQKEVTETTEAQAEAGLDAWIGLLGCILMFLLFLWSLAGKKESSTSRVSEETTEDQSDWA